MLLVLLKLLTPCLSISLGKLYKSQPLNSSSLHSLPAKEEGGNGEGGDGEGDEEGGDEKGGDGEGGDGEGGDGEEGNKVRLRR